MAEDSLSQHFITPDRFTLSGVFYYSVMELFLIGASFVAMVTTIAAWDEHDRWLDSFEKTENFDD